MVSLSNPTLAHSGRFPSRKHRAFAIDVARVYGERKRNFVGQSFWGCFVSTVGRDEAVIRQYIGTGRRRTIAGSN